MKQIQRRKPLFNKIYTPIFKKKKTVSPDVRSVFQLLDTMRLNDKGTLNSYKTTAKTHSTMEKKYSFHYMPNIFFLGTRCWWRRTRIYAHYTFEQSKLKKDFVIMAQVARQNAKTSVEKDFYNLMNNSNFGYDCRNNADNCTFISIFHKIEELSYTKKYQNIFDPNISVFFLLNI